MPQIFSNNTLNSECTPDSYRTATSASCMHSNPHSLPYFLVVFYMLLLNIVWPGRQICSFDRLPYHILSSIPTNTRNLLSTPHSSWNSHLSELLKKIIRAQKMESIIRLSSLNSDNWKMLEKSGRAFRGQIVLARHRW